ncbi:unnamed protein product [Anisakis simplex]|uniref:Glycoprotein n=1 Tax=Anisakis simplex TaxID=6269 RepID=A0A0M3J870_ANISI|nr:unnamed protein product [Anisakis simplex]
MDETTIEPMKLEDCLAMNQNKRFNDVALLAVGENKWESQVPTHYSYGFFGSTCYPVINYQIEKGFILIGEDSQLFSDFGELTGCPIKWNNCTTERRTIWWNVSSIQTQCPYEEIGTYSALKKGSHFLIKELQASLIMASSERNDTKACQFYKPKFMENDIVLSVLAKRDVVRPKRSKKDNTTEILNQEKIWEATQLESPEDSEWDPENPKFQFMVDELQDEIKSQVNIALREDCATRNMVIDVIKYITHNNATTAAKLLLQRNDLRAERGHEGLWISPCKNNETKVNEYPIVFKAGVLSHYNQRKIDLALKLISEEKWIAVKTKRKEDHPEENEEGIIATETEHFIDRVTEDFNIASRGIQQIIEELSEPWVLISISIVAIIALALLLMIFFRCNVFRIVFLIFKICKTKRRKWVRHAERKQSQSELEELRSIDRTIQLNVIPKKAKSTTIYQKLEFRPMEESF